MVRMVFTVESLGYAFFAQVESSIVADVAPVIRLESPLSTTIALILKYRRRTIFSALRSQEDTCVIFGEFMKPIE